MGEAMACHYWRHRGGHSRVHRRMGERFLGFGGSYGLIRTLWLLLLEPVSCHLARFPSLRTIESIAIVVKAGDIDGVCQYDAPIDTITPHFCHTSKWLVTSHYAVFPTLT